MARAEYPTTPDGHRYYEIPLDKAADLIRGFASSQFVDKSSQRLKVYVNPTDPNDQELYTWLWAPGKTQGQGKWVEVRVSWSQTIKTIPIGNSRIPPHESFSVEVLVPFHSLHPELFAFDHIMSDSWRKAIDAKRQSNAVHPNWRMHRNAQSHNEAAAYLTETGESKPTGVTLMIEDLWDGARGYNIQPRDNLNRLQYGKQVAERMAHLVPTVFGYVPYWQKNELPQILRRRDERLRTKKPGWLYQALQRVGGKNLTNVWEKPGVGIEPKAHNVRGTIAVLGVPYEVLGTSIEHNDPRWPYRFTLFFILPESLVQMVTSSDERLLVQRFKSLEAQLGEQKFLQLFTVFGLEKPLKHKGEIIDPVMPDLAEMVVKRVRRIAWSIRFQEHQVLALQEQRVTRDQMVQRAIIIVTNLHKLLSTVSDKKK